MTISLLNPILRDGNVPRLVIYPPIRGTPDVSNFTPNREDVDLVRYYRNQASALDRANLEIQAMARESNDLKDLEQSIERYGRSAGIVIAFQLLRESALPMGKAKR
jgi:hypothetical protein